MKRLTKIAAVATMAFASVSYAQQVRVETPISTGPGGFTLIVSTPAGASGPYDFWKNKGPKINTINGDTYGELQYESGLLGSETAKIFYQTVVYRDDNANERGKPYTAEVIAQNMIKDLGFVGRAVKFDCPDVNFIFSSMVCYKTQGIPKFKEEKIDHRVAVTIVSIALRNNTQGFAYVGSVYDTDTKKFDADPTYAAKGATSSAAGMFKNSHLQMN